jgi:Toprim-like
VRRNLNSTNNALSEAVVDGDRLEDLLIELGCEQVKAIRGGETFRCACPVHGGDDLNMQVETGGDSLAIRWTCYSHQCQTSWVPTLLGLVRGALSNQRGENVSPKAAVDYLEEFLGSRPAVRARPAPVRSKPPSKLLNITRARLRERLVVPSPYFVSRGFSPAILDGFDVGHSTKLGKSIVPLHSDDGQVCVGYMARSEWPACTQCRRYHRPGADCWARYAAPKWTMMEDFAKGSHLYNYHGALRSPSRVVVLMEGPGDVWRVAEAGYLAVAMLGLDLSRQQAQMLRALQKSVLLVLDNDTPGRKARYRLEECLSRAVRGVHSLYLPPRYKDLGDIPLEEARSWLAAHITNP